MSKEKDIAKKVVDLYDYFKNHNGELPYLNPDNLVIDDQEALRIFLKGLALAYDKANKDTYKHIEDFYLEPSLITMTTGIDLFHIDETRFLS